MSAGSALNGLNVLINASNLHAGGGVAVASSVVAALAGMQDTASSFTVLASTEVAQNLNRMGASLESFRFIPFDTHGLSGALWKKPVRVRDFDIVLTIFGPLYSPVVGAKNVMGFAQPWVAYPHNSAYGLLSTLERMRTRLKYEVVAGFFASADALIVEQEGVRGALMERRRFRGKQIFVVPNVVDSLHFDKSRWIPVTLPPRSGKLRLGVVSRSYPHKNLGIFPNVQRSLRENHGIEAEFLVTMTESEFAECSVEFREVIANFGALDLAEVPSFNSQLDGVVLPTLLECYSATPIEALAARAPLFASDRPFIRDTVGEHANYFDPVDPGSIARSIADYFSLPPEERSRREDAGYRYVAGSGYTSQDRARALMEVVRKVAAGSPERSSGTCQAG